MRGAPAWRGRHSVQHPSSVSALRADPPPGGEPRVSPRPSDPTRGEGKAQLTACRCAAAPS
ncbi:MAG: hypothetical protein EOS42_10970 [Mesorhizobium sp.]|nr:hypothetical protein EOA23_32170 [Mesorhizobium sp. M2A.F.Ca.ET.042.01.1.1]RWE76523.1 MAG: hypothetical protein EOS42_10970 [Mesorhizobium sp.]TIV31809.1 MAG: hypothetical protein E5V90_05765 [Mesorhizobium sp.]